MKLKLKIRGWLGRWLARKFSPDPIPDCDCDSCIAFRKGVADEHQ